MTEVKQESAQSKESRARVVRLAHERGDLVQGDDGFWIYWPTRSMGAVSAHELRYIADELDRMNAPWQADIDRYFASEEGKKFFSGPEVSFAEVIPPVREVIPAAREVIPPVRELVEEESVCAQIQPSGENARHVRLGGGRYMCGKPYRHAGAHGDWKLVSQPEHARAEHTHRISKTRFVRG